MIRCTKYPSVPTSNSYRYTVSCPTCDGISEYKGYNTLSLTKAQDVKCGHCGIFMVNCENLGKNIKARMRYHKDI